MTSHKVNLGKIESVQYKATLAIAGAIQGTSRDKIYQVLGLDTLDSYPYYLINLIPKYEPIIRTRNNSNHHINIKVAYTIFSTLKD